MKGGLMDKGVHVLAVCTCARPSSLPECKRVQSRSRTEEDFFCFLAIWGPFSMTVGFLRSWG